MKFELATAFIGHIARGRRDRTEGLVFGTSCVEEEDFTRRLKDTYKSLKADNCGG